ncbi:uncharacterized protein LOC120696118, partial [Panicum virgatum]|uniref:uncharacterized protein LOC120696118 n=1 Tax=Panicum virgatum TaxID=38727 RepID=UPI0019D69457
MQMDRQWMYNADRRSKEFIDGLHYFLSVAEANKQNGFMCCPCVHCNNNKDYSSSRILHSHIFANGFMKKYVCWTKHGEQGVTMEDNEEEDFDDHFPGNAGIGAFDDDIPMEEPEVDVAENDPSDDLGQALHNVQADCESETERLKFQKLLEDHHKLLYPDCQNGFKKLGTTLELLQWKATNGVSDKGFGELLKLVKKMLPKDNELPATTYEAKQLVCPLGLEVQKIHACPNDCILYRGEYENLDACPVCSALRYKIRKDDPGDVEGEPPRKRVPAKVMWYLPIIPRLKRLFRNKDNAKLMRWHKEERKKDSMLRHPADGSQWRKIDRTYPKFDLDARNIRFGLSTDGMNPFGEMSSGHSTWPVTLCLYNLPPWLCMKRKFIMMPVLIPGPKQPGNDIDVYLRPLVEELLLLWGDEGVRMWDEYKQENFNLRALLFVTINDWPALSNLSGHSNKGYKACTHCLDDTDNIWLTHCKKVVYMGHRRFLPIRHAVRKKGKHFKGQADHRTKPMHRSGKDVFNMVKDLEVVFGKGSGSQPVPNENGMAPMWKKKSIFWELPYWEVLDRDNGRQYLSPASYTLSKEEKETMFDCLSSIKVPSGYSSNIKGILNLAEKKFTNLKSHDCHVLMTELLPVVLRGILPDNVRARPEGSIASAYGTEEVIDFCVDFIDDLKLIGVPESRYEGRLSGKGTLGKKSYVCTDDFSFKKAHYTVLQQSSLVDPYIEEHKKILLSNFPEKSEAWITREHMNTFCSWLRKHLMHNMDISEQLFLLARGPSWNILTYQGYEINGNTFYTIAQDKKSTNQNSGVRMDATDNNGKKDTYYGYIEEIWELDYGPNFKVPLFRCQWVKLSGGGVTKDEYGMTIVDLNNLGYRDEPFVLAQDVAQVFYIKDMSSKPKKGINKQKDEPKRHIVLSGKRNIVGVEDKTDFSEEYNNFVAIPPFEVNADPCILLANDDAPYLRRDHNQGTFVK